MPEPEFDDQLNESEAEDAALELAGLLHETPEPVMIANTEPSCSSGNRSGPVMASCARPPRSTMSPAEARQQEFLHECHVRGSEFERTACNMNRGNQRGDDSRR